MRSVQVSLHACQFHSTSRIGYVPYYLHIIRSLTCEQHRLLLTAPLGFQVEVFGARTSACHGGVDRIGFPDRSCRLYSQIRRHGFPELCQSPDHESVTNGLAGERTPRRVLNALSRGSTRRWCWIRYVFLPTEAAVMSLSNSISLMRVLEFVN